MGEYLEVWDHISKKKKKGWRIAETHRNLEEAFRSGNKVVRWAVHDRVENNLQVCLYHTPVTTRLRKDGEKLGNYLYSMKKSREPNDQWWIRLKTELTDTAARLKFATAGTLLGPPMILSGTRNVDMKMETPPGSDPETLMKRMGGSGIEMSIKVNYLNALPGPIEPEAIVWWDGS
ncbi:hypothetical protein [Nitrosococcus oceani]|uniref:hypothetical protein n=1 Tax=Nitrosococcus oceani TaxID=1229 RepID=UPI0004E8F3FF|nr:hypothetical protein [Nitrosococcus oceani]KFI23740.1 hypothetical protein HW44_02245 [Nitrosococcus oceani]